MGDAEFLAGELDTGFLERYFARRVEGSVSDDDRALAAEAWKRARKRPQAAAQPVSNWKLAGRIHD
jgi:hypothetical protein